MEVELRGKLIDCDFDEWKFEEKSGIRYFGVIKDENKKLITFKIEEKDFKNMKQMLGKDISIKCNIFIKGTYSLKYIGEYDNIQ